MASSLPTPLELRKVKNFLSKAKEEQRSYIHNYDNVYIISDSKGKYMERQRAVVSDIIDTSNVQFWYRGGRNTVDGVRFLETKLLQNGFRPGRSVVLFWHVTCDLNIFKRPERWLLPRFQTPDGILELVKPSLDRLVQIHHQNSNIDIGILETPPVFWSKWNQLNDHPNWNSFNDKLMHEQVDIVNAYIRDILNNNLNYRSPKFLLDCMESRKRKGSQIPGHRNSLSSVLYFDGVHPADELSQKWFLQIVRSVCK